MSKIQNSNTQEVNWERELKLTATKYHIIGCWVAAIFNALFFVTDYINVYEFWELFLIVRLSVSAVTLSALFLRKPLKITPEILIFIPFLLISLQNAFMWSLMDAEHLQKHTLAYVALFIGAGMLLLWKMKYSIIVVVVSIIANIIFFYFDSELTLQEDLVNGGLLTASVAAFSILLIQTRYRLTKKEIIARLSMERSNRLLEQQKEKILESNRNITDSIRYAKRIQDSILPMPDYIEKYLSQNFILNKPRDIVSGDFYWFGHHKEKSIIAAVDCTGHGVPGAFMSLIGSRLLNKFVIDSRYLRPADILNKLRTGVIKALQQEHNDVDSKDGMDIALCVIDHANNKLDFAGAFNPLYLVRNGTLQVIKADRMPIGMYYKKDKIPFTNHQVDLQENDMIYMFSDGYSDQFGGEEDRKFGSKRFKNFLTDLADKPVHIQKQELDTNFINWKGSRKQLDDVLVIGIKFTKHELSHMQIT